jgi:hypothetical protein
MHVINIPTAKQIVQHVAIRLAQPVMFVGQFGAGKSEGVQQAVNEANAIMCDVRLGQYDTVDLKGYPDVNDQTGFTVWHPASTLPFEGNDLFPDNVPVILFLDEITSCTPPVFAVAYQLVNELRVGEHKLKPNVRIVCAGNRESDRGVVNRMPMPLANRMTWFEIGIDVDAWCEYAQSRQWNPLFIAFMQFRKPLLCTYDPAKTDKVVATPRTWEKAIQYFDDKVLPQDVKLAALAGCIGDGPAAELMGFVNVWTRITPIKDVIADPMGAPVPDETSMRYAMAVNVSGNMSLKTIAPLHQYLCRFDPEYVVMAWQLATKRDDALFTTKEFIDFSKRFKVVFS